MKKEILESCKYWEDVRPNSPFNYKAGNIAKEHSLSQEEAEKYLEFYQKTFQVTVVGIDYY